MASEKEKILNFLNEQMVQASFKAHAYIYDEENHKNPQRSIFIKLKGYLNHFLKENSPIRWITLTGLRGAGKTTLLSQIFNEPTDETCYKLFLSLDQTSQIIGASLDEVMSVYEEIIGRSLESLDKPLLLFLDEVQYDQTWGIVLKTIYDRTKKVFILATGSAALLMNKNTDIARRTVYEKLFPLNFPEYLKIKYKKYEVKGLGKKTKNAIFLSENAKIAFENLKEIEKEANVYYGGVTKHEFNKYIHYGSLPFMVTSDNEAIVYDQINKTLDRVITGDLLTTGHFSSEIISKIPRILYALADMDAFNISVLSESFGISRQKVAEILDLLEQTEVIHRIFPYGSHLNQVKKPSKYLFSSPAFRSMYYKMIGNTISEINARSKLLEDLVGMYLYRFVYKNPGAFLAYDSAQGGADFILGFGHKKLIIEVGSGKKNYKQIIQTSKKVESDYNLIISSDTLEYSEEHNTIKVPLRLFLLT